MNAHEQPATAAELTYRPTMDDFREAVRARDMVPSYARYVRRGCLVAVSHQARRLHRAAAPRGEHRAVVDGSGIGIATERSSRTLAWQEAPRCAETPALFVLLGADRNATVLAVLPKRGVADEAAVTRLRDILRQHTGLVGKPRPGRPDTAATTAA